MEATLTDSLETTATISVRDLRVNYGEREILHGITFDVNRGETLVILGGSGSGKSTLLRTLVGLEKPTSGQIWIKGQDIAQFLRPLWMKSARNWHVFQVGALRLHDVGETLPCRSANTLASRNPP